jgi:hypothetical protein
MSKIVFFNSHPRLLGRSAPYLLYIIANKINRVQVSSTIHTNTSLCLLCTYKKIKDRSIQKSIYSNTESENATVERKIHTCYGAPTSVTQSSGSPTRQTSSFRIFEFIVICCRLSLSILCRVHNVYV